MKHSIVTRIYTETRINQAVGRFASSRFRESRVFEETRAEGKIEGKIEGKAEEIEETGYEFGLPEQAILERLQKKLAITSD